MGSCNWRCNFTYEWSNGATTENIYLQNVIGVDTICVTITDANGCTSTSCERRF